MKKLLLSAVTTASLLFGLVANANETLKVDRDFALNRAVEIEVTPLGVVLDFSSPVDAVNLSHMGEITFIGMNGILCEIPDQCPKDSAPTMLLIRKIPKINFPDQEPTQDGSSMLFVNTESGLYRFRFKPVNKMPQYTKVEIDLQPLPPLLNAERTN